MEMIGLAFGLILSASKVLGVNHHKFSQTLRVGSSEALIILREAVVTVQLNLIQFNQNQIGVTT